MLVFDSDDEYRLTGTETRPKEIVAEAIERAGMSGRVMGMCSKVLADNHVFHFNYVGITFVM